MTENIHQGQPVLHYGTQLEDAKLVVILLHGRGATAESMLSLADTLHSSQISFLAPQAALNRTGDMLVNQMREKGFLDQQIAFGGFSQGACLSSEYLARNASRYAGLFVFSGALIGPASTPRNYEGSFDGMSVFIGGSDVDPWVAHDFIKETASVFNKMGARVDFRTYPGMGHTVNQDELEAVRAMLVSAKELVAA